MVTVVDDGYSGFACDVCIEEKYTGANWSTTFRKCQFCKRDTCESHQIRIFDPIAKVIKRLNPYIKPDPMFYTHAWCCSLCAKLFKDKYDKDLGAALDKLISLRESYLKKWKNLVDKQKA
jgi:hypothetical protein